VEGFGEKSTDESDSKIAVSKIKIGAAISLFDMIKLGVECILKRVNFKDAAATNTGDRSAATNTGDRSAATNTGSRSAATNTGDQSAATNTGYQSAATNTGYQSAATNTGYQSAATNTGYQSAATNTGDQSAATNTGYQSAASVEGKESIACGLGIENKAKASLGSWIVLTEWGQGDNGGWHIKSLKSAKIDGRKLKADVWYELKNGKFVEVK
jgi:transcription elongation factor